MKADAWALAQCIDWAGQHALALYFGMLALLLAATSAGRLAWPRSTALRWASRRGVDAARHEHRVRAVVAPANALGERIATALEAWPSGLRHWS